MFGMVRLREVRHKYTYTFHWQFGDSPSADSDMRSVRASTTEYICLPTCLSVSLSVCLSKCLLPLASDWSTQRKYVVVTLDQTGNSGGKRFCPVFQVIWAWAKKNWLHVCLSATSLLSSLLKTWLLSLITILYTFNVDRAFLWEIILVNKWALFIV